MSSSKPFDHDKDIHASVDASDLRCPLPLLKAKQGLRALSSGQRLKVIATDPGSVRDFQAFADLSGNVLVHVEQVGQRYIYILQKA